MLKDFFNNKKALSKYYKDSADLSTVLIIVAGLALASVLGIFFIIDSSKDKSKATAECIANFNQTNARGSVESYCGLAGANDDTTTITPGEGGTGTIPDELNEEDKKAYWLSQGENINGEIHIPLIYYPQLTLEDMDTINLNDEEKNNLLTLFDTIRTIDYQKIIKDKQETLENNEKKRDNLINNTTINSQQINQIIGILNDKKVNYYNSQQASIMEDCILIGGLDSRLEIKQDNVSSEDKETVKTYCIFPHTNPLETTYSQQQPYASIHFDTLRIS